MENQCHFYLIILQQQKNGKTIGLDGIAMEAFMNGSSKLLVHQAIGLLLQCSLAIGMFRGQVYAVCNNSSSQV